MRFLLNLLTVLMLLLVAALLVWGVYTYIDPLQPYNPFPPTTAFESTQNLL